MALFDCFASLTVVSSAMLKKKIGIFSELYGEKLRCKINMKDTFVFKCFYLRRCISLTTARTGSRLIESHC